MSVLHCISISRKGQYSISVIVILFEAQVISPDLACPNQLAGGGSEIHSCYVSLDCCCLAQVTKDEKPVLRSFQDLSLREYGEAGEWHPG